MTGSEAYLASARVEIDVAGDTTSVQALYQFRSARRPVPLHLFRATDVTVDHVEAESAGEPMHLEAMPGLYRLVAPPGGEVDVAVRYRVAGNPRRIPVFVPDVPTLRERSEVVIHVTGARAAAGADDGFPRFEAAPGGSIAARPANVPSVVVLPRRSGLLSVDGVATGAVVALIAIGSVWWAGAIRKRIRDLRFEI